MERSIRMTTPKDLNEEALTAAEDAVRAQLVEWRDRRFSSLTDDGFVINEADGELSPMIRMSTRAGLEIAITAYLAAIGGQQA
jgi:hypothetical protein